MFKESRAFSGFSVNDTEKAREFYGQTLGLDVSEANEMGIFSLQLAGGGVVIVYPKPDHVPATFTILNFPVEDIDAAADELAAKGVELIRYDNPDMPQDEKGVLRGLGANMGSNIAWFNDPSGNVLAILQEK